MQTITPTQGLKGADNHPHAGIDHTGIEGCRWSPQQTRHSFSLSRTLPINKTCKIENNNNKNKTENKRKQVNDNEEEEAEEEEEEEEEEEDDDDDDDDDEEKRKQKKISKHK